MWTTMPGVTVNAGTAGIFAENCRGHQSRRATTAQYRSRPRAQSTRDSISGTNLLRSWRVTLGAPAHHRAIPNPPLTGIFGNVTVNSSATITAKTGVGINAFDYGTGNVSVSNFGAITATAAGATAVGFAQYGIAAVNYGVGNTSVVDAPPSGVTINSGSIGILAANQATVISTPTTVTVTALGPITSGTNLSNGGTGSPPAGIVATINPGNAGVYNANVTGNILVFDAGNITAGAGDGIRANDYGVGNVVVELGQQYDHFCPDLGDSSIGREIRPMASAPSLTERATSMSPC